MYAYRPLTVKSCSRLVTERNKPATFQLENRPCHHKKYEATLCQGPKGFVHFFIRTLDTRFFRLEHQYVFSHICDALSKWY